jgi:uncharacterized coiled-coil protein SlyX
MALEENLRARIYDLECQLRHKEKETTNVTVDISEEIQRLKRELHAMRLLLNTKQKQLRPSNRRNKRRVYFP